jgi:hypothetical protein
MCKYRVVLQYLSSFGQNRQLRNVEDPAPVNRQASIDVSGQECAGTCTGALWNIDCSLPFLKTSQWVYILQKYNEVYG